MFRSLHDIESMFSDQALRKQHLASSAPDGTNLLHAIPWHIGCGLRMRFTVRLVVGPAAHRPGICQKPRFDCLASNYDEVDRLGINSILAFRDARHGLAGIKVGQHYESIQIGASLPQQTGQPHSTCRSLLQLPLSASHYNRVHQLQFLLLKPTPKVSLSTSTFSECPSTTKPTLTTARRHPASWTAKRPPVP